MMYDRLRELIHGRDVNAGDEVRSKSPGSKGMVGKVLTIKDGNALVQFENGKKWSVPANHLEKK